MPSTEANKPLHVAVAVIRRDNGDILIARRNANAHQGGLWEFPGGKRESGEDILQALTRELHEELGIDIARSACRQLTHIHHDYSDKSVHLDVWWIDGFTGIPEGKEGQPLRWVSIAQLADYSFPEANKPILDAILAD
jgi:8-oxo-dGTP diphosphatase